MSIASLDPEDHVSDMIQANMSMTEDGNCTGLIGILKGSQVRLRPKCIRGQVGYSLRWSGSTAMLHLRVCERW